MSKITWYLLIYLFCSLYVFIAEVVPMSKRDNLDGVRFRFWITGIFALPWILFFYIIASITDKGGKNQKGQDG